MKYWRFSLACLIPEGCQQKQMGCAEEKAEDDRCEWQQKLDVCWFLLLIIKWSVVSLDSLKKICSCTAAGLVVLFPFLYLFIWRWFFGDYVFCTVYCMPSLLKHIFCSIAVLIKFFHKLIVPFSGIFFCGKDSGAWRWKISHPVATLPVSIQVSYTYKSIGIWSKLP